MPSNERLQLSAAPGAAPDRGTLWGGIQAPQRDSGAAAAAEAPLRYKARVRSSCWDRRGSEVKIRDLERHELNDIWLIDRAEVIDKVYYHDDEGLVLKREQHDVHGWPAGEPGHYGPILLDCFDRGGTLYGAFHGETLIGAMMLESRFIGREKDQLQLKFLHVSRHYRKEGLGRTLFDKAVGRASELGARRLYISATPSENTVRFYLRCGCRVTDDVDAALFELEPKDIHLKFDIPV